MAACVALRYTTHDELVGIVEAVNMALDSRIKWDKRYNENQNDLTKEPDLIAEHLCRAGGHAVKNWTRRCGPAYAEVVHDVCRAINAIPSSASRDAIDGDRSAKGTLREGVEGVISVRSRKAFEGNGRGGWPTSLLG
jgi:hypothetical protein